MPVNRGSLPARQAPGKGRTEGGTARLTRPLGELPGPEAMPRWVGRGQARRARAVRGRTSPWRPGAPRSRERGMWGTGRCRAHQRPANRARPGHALTVGPSAMSGAPRWAGARGARARPARVGSGCSRESMMDRISAACTAGRGWRTRRGRGEASPGRTRPATATPAGAADREAAGAGPAAAAAGAAVALAGAG